MPISETHKRQRAKNFFLLGVLVALAAGLFYLSIIKVSGA